MSRREDREFEGFRDEIEAASRKVAREIDPGVRAVFVAVLVLVLAATLILPHCGSVAGYEVLTFSPRAVEERVAVTSRVFMWLVVVFGIGASMLTGEVGRGDSVAVFGCGGVGDAAILGAKLAGATTIVAVDLDPKKLEMARHFGATHTVDASAGDPVEGVRDATGGLGADVVIEAVGAAATARQSLELVRPGGQVTWIGNSQPVIEVNMPSIVTREITIRGAYAFNREFGDAIEAIRSGRVDVMALVEDVLPLSEGPRVVTELAKGQLDAIKIVLKP